jgi:hypothetical protein
VSASSVRSFVSRRLVAAGQPRERANAAQPPAPKPPSARALSFAFLCRAENRGDEEQARLEALRDIDAELTEALGLAATFAAMARKQVTVVGGVAGAGAAVVLPGDQEVRGGHSPGRGRGERGANGEVE